MATTLLPCQSSDLHLHFLELKLGALQAAVSLCPTLISNVEKPQGPFYFQNRPECAIVFGQQEFQPLEGFGLPVELGSLSSDYLQRTYSREPTTPAPMALQTVR